MESQAVFKAKTQAKMYYWIATLVPPEEIHDDDDTSEILFGNVRIVLDLTD